MGRVIQIFNPFCIQKKKYYYDKVGFVMATGQTFMIKNNSFILTKKNYALVLIVRKNMYTNIYQGPKMSQNHKLWFVSIQCRKSNKVYV